jgi:glycerol-3-phosphate cytidylyltransferase
MELKKRYNILFTSGTFDIINEGHINLLAKAKSLCNKLVVAVSTDKLIEQYKHLKPIQPLSERLKIMKSIKYVDKVIIQHNFMDVKQFASSGADKFVLGDDWKTKPGQIPWVYRISDLIIYLPYTKTTSSTMIKEKIIKESYEIIQAQLLREHA